MPINCRTKTLSPKIREFAVRSQSSVNFLPVKISWEKRWPGIRRNWWKAKNSSILKSIYNVLYFHWLHKYKIDLSHPKVSTIFIPIITLHLTDFWDLSSKALLKRNFYNLLPNKGDRKKGVFFSTLYSFKRFVVVAKWPAYFSI